MSLFPTVCNPTLLAIGQLYRQVTGKTMVDEAPTLPPRAMEILQQVDCGRWTLTRAVVRWVNIDGNVYVTVVKRE